MRKQTEADRAASHESRQEDEDREHQEERRNREEREARHPGGVAEGDHGERSDPKEHHREAEEEYEVRPLDITVKGPDRRADGDLSPVHETDVIVPEGETAESALVP